MKKIGKFGWFVITGVVLGICIALVGAVRGSYRVSEQNSTGTQAESTEVHHVLSQWPIWEKRSNHDSRKSIEWHMLTRNVDYIVRCDYRNDLMFTNHSSWHTNSAVRLPDSEVLEFCLVPGQGIANADLVTDIGPRH